MEFLMNNLPIFIPLLVAQVAFGLVALVQVLKPQLYHTTYYFDCIVGDIVNNIYFRIQ